MESDGFKIYKGSSGFKSKKNEKIIEAARYRQFLNETNKDFNENRFCDKIDHYVYLSFIIIYELLSEKLYDPQHFLTSSLV
jgi:hypothetical protein